MEESLLKDKSEMDFTTSDSSSIDNSKEDIKFGLYHPFKTLLMLTPGPLVFAFSSTFQDFMDLFFVKKRFMEYGVSIIGMAAMIRFILLGMASFMGSAITVRISALVAQKKFDEGGKLLVDAFKVMLCVDIVVPLLIFFFTKELLLFLGTVEENIKYCSQYLYPIMLSMFFVTVFQVFCCALLGEAKSNLCALIQILSLFVSLFIADPLFIFVFKFPLWSLGFAYVSGPIICGIGLGFFYFSGKFSIKPKLSTFLSPLSPEILTTLKLSLPSVVSIFSSVFPPMLMMSYTNAAAKAIGKKREVNVVISAMVKPYNLLASLSIGCFAGLAPAASYSYAVNRYNRTKRLFLYSMIIPESLIIVFGLLMIVSPNTVMGIYLSDQSSFEMSKLLVPTLYYTFFLTPISEACSSLLLATGHGALAIIPPASRSISMIIGSIVMYRFNKTSPQRVLNSFLGISDYWVSSTKKDMELYSFR